MQINEKTILQILLHEDTEIIKSRISRRYATSCLLPVLHVVDDIFKKHLHGETKALKECKNIIIMGDPIRSPNLVFELNTSLIRKVVLLLVRC